MNTYFILKVVSDNILIGSEKIIFGISNPYEITVIKDDRVYVELVGPDTVKVLGRVENNLINLATRIPHHDETYLTVCKLADADPNYYSEWRYRRLSFIGPILREVKYSKELLIKAEELRCYDGYTPIEV
jgi:hypothetical protein